MIPAQSIERLLADIQEHPAVTVVQRQEHAASVWAMAAVSRDGTVLGYPNATSPGLRDLLLTMQRSDAARYATARSLYQQTFYPDQEYP